MLNEMLTNNFAKLNTATKYPSILTYHVIGDKGRLKDELSYNVPFENEEVYFTEKVDGTNSRIIICGDDYIIGSREELLYAKGDRVTNPTLGIVNTLKPIAERLVRELELKVTEFVVIYGETYGGNIGKNKKNYTKSGEFGYRMFDLWKMSGIELLGMFNLISQSEISLWRENGGQPFVSVEELNAYNDKLNLPKVPQLLTMQRNDLPSDIEGIYELLKNYERTKVGLDEHGKSEGLIVRSKDRGFITKIRFEDYEKTLGIKNKKKK